jgi:hypothetical protein
VLNPRTWRIVNELALTNARQCFGKFIASSTGMKFITPLERMVEVMAALWLIHIILKPIGRSRAQLTH